MKKHLISFCFLLFGTVCINAQDTYELLYLQGDIDKIQKKAEKKSSINDYYWYAITLNIKGKMHQAIPVLEEGIRFYNDNEKLELLLSDLYFETGNYPKATL